MICMDLLIILNFGINVLVLKNELWKVLEICFTAM